MNTLEMKTNSDVLGHIKNINAERERLAEEEGGFIFYVAESVADRFDNVYEYELEMARQCYSDARKDKVGFRPSLDPNWTLEDFEQAIDNL